MAIPTILLQHFPPSNRLLFDLAREDFDDSMLWEVANADYGYDADEAFACLQSIRDNGSLPSSMPFIAREVLELTRWCKPELPNSPPFDPGPAGTRGHRIRLFACAILLFSESDSSNEVHVCSDDSSLANCLVSAGVLGDQISHAIACLSSASLDSAQYPLFYAIVLQTAALRLRAGRFTEHDLGEIAEWVLALEPSWLSPRNYSSHAGPEPAPFSFQKGLWAPVARELEKHATTIQDPIVREKVFLTAMLLQPN